MKGYSILHTAKTPNSKIRMKLKQLKNSCKVLKYLQINLHQEWGMNIRYLQLTAHKKDTDQELLRIIEAIFNIFKLKNRRQGKINQIIHYELLSPFSQAMTGKAQVIQDPCSCGL